MSEPEALGDAASRPSASGDADPAGPLHGIRVIELAHVMAGPVCGLMLADLGADVVKIERPTGDPTRKFVPPEQGGEAAAFLMLNRNKRSMALDIKHPDGRDALLRLLGDADVLIENYRPGSLARSGLDYAALEPDFPRLVYCSITGYGSSGPMATDGGLDLIAQGYSGIMSITGEGEGRPPVKVGVPLTDIGAGILAALGVVSALHRRHQTRRGQHVETSLFEAGLMTTFWQAAIALASGQSPGPMGSAHPLAAPYEAFRTADGWMTLGTPTQTNWERLPDVLGMPELLDDDRFGDNAGRLQYRRELVALVQERIEQRTTSDWMAALGAAGIPAGPVLNVGEALHHAQSQAREMLAYVDHPTAGRVATIGPPIKLSESPASIRGPAPLFGQHTREVLSQIGYQDAEIEAMLGAGAAIAGPATAS